jgi:hypothetical protein
MWLWPHDVWKQFRGGGTAILVLGCNWMGDASCSQKVRADFSVHINNIYSFRTKSFSMGILLASVLIPLRILRRWNQTGQKFAGQPDIGREFLPAHSAYLWSLVAVTIANELLEIALLTRYNPLLCSILVFTLASSTLYKLAFVYADAPELLSGLNVKIIQYLSTLSLVPLAQLSFFGLFVSTILIMFTKKGERKTQSKVKNSKYK